MSCLPSYSNITLSKSPSSECVDLVTDKDKLKQRVGELLFALNDVSIQNPLEVLNMFQKTLTDLKTYPEFVRTLQPRVNKLIDKLIIPSLLIGMSTKNSFTESGVDQCSYEKREVILEKVTMIIAELFLMGSHGLLIEENSKFIILDHLLSCQMNIIRKTEELKTQKLLMRELFCDIFQNINLSTISLGWFLNYSKLVEKRSLCKELLYSSLSYHLDVALKDGALLKNNDQKLIIQRLINSFTSTDSQRACLQSKLELLEDNSEQKLKSEKSKTVLVTPSKNSNRSQNSSCYMNYLPRKDSNSPIKPPSWINLFEPLTMRSEPTLKRTSPERSFPVALTDKKTKGFWRRVWETITGWVFKISKKHCHHSYADNQANSLVNRTISKNVKYPRKVRQQRVKRSNTTMQKLRSRRYGNKKNFKSRQIHLRSKRARGRYVNKNKKSFGASQKLGYYYKLHRRSLDVRRLKDYTFERTYLGEVRGGVHKLQIKYQTKLDKLRFMIHGYDID